MFSSKILAFESYVPDNIVSNDMLSDIVETSDEWIYSRTGISNRRITKGQNTSELASNVAKKLLEKTGILPEDIDIVIVATITPDYLTPSTACIVQGALGTTTALAFDINVACSGFVYALSIADKFLKTGMYKNAIVIGADVLSKILDWEDRATCVLFGDGAGGVLLTRSSKEHILAEDIKADGSSWEAIKGGYLGIKNPFSKEELKENLYLNMNGRDVFNFATKTVPKSIQALLEKSNITLDEVKYIVPHQANIRIVEVVAKKLKQPMEKFYLNMQNYGNTSAGSVPIALSEMDKKGLLEKDDLIIITGFGAGLTWGSMLIKI